MSTSALAVPSTPSKLRSATSSSSIRDASASKDKDMKDNSKEKQPNAQDTTTGAMKPEDITSPHELTNYVEKLLDNLESKFDDMSSQILERMSQMSSRVDALEASIQDIINGDITTSPGNSTPPVSSR